MARVSVTSCCRDYKLGKTDAPLVERSMVLILSLLVSLMVDQVRSLRSQGVSAAVLEGLDQSLVASDTGISQGKYRLLYAAPEAVVEDHKSRMLLLAPPLCSTLVATAVDEAHCVYKW